MTEKNVILSDEGVLEKRSGLNGWWKLILGLLIGALAPSLIAWGSMSAKIEGNKEMIDKKVNMETFEQFKEGNSRLLETICTSLERIELKLDKKSSTR